MLHSGQILSFQIRYIYCIFKSTPEDLDLCSIQHCNENEMHLVGFIRDELFQSQNYISL